ncbi:MAG: IclR family transcriptional regulator [Salinibacter sp.]
MSDKYTVTAVDRAFEVLESLSQSDEELSLVDLAQETDIPKSTLFRILSTLEDWKCVVRDEKQKTYQLGLRLMELGNAYRDQSDLLDVAEKHMEALARDCQESVFLGMLDGEEIVYVRQKASRKSAIFVQKLGKRAPVYCTATGLAMLAFRPEEEVARILDASDLEAHTANTTTDREVLERKLEQIRESGVAVVDGAYNPALLCVSAPVFEEEGTPVASVTVALLSARVGEERIEAMKDRVRSVARELSRERGHFEDRPFGVEVTP